jgi:hypothetical protein
MEQQETFNYIYALSWHIKLAGNKVWSGANKRYLERWHEAWF